MSSVLVSPSIRKNKFTFREDAVLRGLVQDYGTNDWMAIASHMHGRDSRQCKERWFHYLSPNLVQFPWNPADDALLELRVVQHGHKWKMFESDFPGRTDISIKNRFNVLARRRMRQLRIGHDSIAEAGSPVHNVSEDSHFEEPADSPESSLCWADAIDWEDFWQS
jgi:hypothetical protein